MTIRAIKGYPEREILEKHPFPPPENRTPDASLFYFDLPSLIEMMKHSHTWAQGELNAMVLLKRQDKQIVLTALHEGTEIISYQSEDSVTFQIIEGRINFHTRKETVILDKDRKFTLYDNIKYSLETKEETVLLLTIITRTSNLVKI